MSKYIATNHVNPCVICQKTNGNCRTFDDSDLVLCMSHQDDDYQHIGYKFTKPTKDGLWGIYVPLEEQIDYSQKRRQAYQKVIEAKEQARKEALSEGLSIRERDRNIRLLHKHLGLSSKDRQKLRDRGLSDRQIDRGLFFSVTSYQKIPEFIDTRLPGVFIGKNGKPTLKGDEKGSIACVAFNDDLAIGWQYRHQRKNNKYTWAKGIKSSHLKSGELPITHLVANSDDKTLWLCEGILKPYITHCRFNLNIAGTSSFNFSHSKEQITQVIKNHNYQNIVVDLDAGAVTNYHVMRQFHRNIELFQSLNVNIKVAWWGQIFKEKLDIDELENLDRVKLIDWEKFKSRPILNRKKLKKNQDYNSQDYSLKQFKQDLDNREFSKFQKDLIVRVNHLSRSFKRGFGNKKLIIPDLHPTKYIYDPNRPLPVPSDYTGDNFPSIVIPTKYKDIRHKLITELVNKGWKHIFDRSQTGSGKSHTVALLNKVIYLDTNYQNPSVEEIKQFPAMTPRSQYGIYYDRTAATEANRGKTLVDPPPPVRERATQLEKGNCHLKSAFRILETKGYQAEQESLPCRSCQHINYCGSVDYLFKGARKSAIKEIVKECKGRMHPSQLTVELLQNSFDDFLLVWEEAGTKKAVFDIIFTRDNINQAIAILTQVEGIDRSLIEQLIKVLIKLNSLTDYHTAISLTNSQKYYGLDRSTIFDNLPELPSFTDDELERLLLSYFTPDVKLPSLINPIGGEIEPEYKQQLKNAERYLRKELKQELEDTITAVAPNFFLLFNALLRRTSETTISITKQGKILVSQFNTTYRDLANNALANLYLDATATIQQIRGFYGIPHSGPMITIQTEAIALNNIQIFNLNTKGLSSYDWSQTAIGRVKALINTIKSQNQSTNIAVICPKSYSDELGTNFYYGRDDRGSNELSNYDAIIFVGTPNVNLGDAQRSYELIYGDNSEFTFEQYYNQLRCENRWQGTGRHRGQYQLDKELHQFYICTEEDLSYFRIQGMNLTNLDAEIVNPECGTKGDRTLFQIKQSIVSLVEAGKKVTQKKVADIIGLTRDGIAHTMRNFQGGWKVFKKCVISLIDSFKGKLHKNDDESNWLKMYWQEKPHEIVDITIKNIQGEGLVDFLKFIHDVNADIATALSILWSIAPLWDKRFDNHFWRQLSNNKISKLI